MTIGRALATALVAALGLTGLAASDPPLSLDVTLVDEAGAPTVGAKLEAHVMVPNGARIASVALPSATTNADGQASIAVGTGARSPAWLSDADQGGLVTIKFVGDGVYHEIMYVPPNTSETGRWELHPLNGFDAQLATDNPSADLTEQPAATAVNGRVVLAATGLPDNPYAECAQVDPLGYIEWRRTGYSIEREAILMRAFTRNRGRIRYRWSTAENTSLGAAMRTPAGQWIDLGLAVSWNQSGNGGIQHTWPNGRHRILRAIWDWRRWKAVCVIFGGEFDTGYTEMRPDRYTGYTTLRKAVSRVWGCDRANNAGPHAARLTWQENSRSTRWVGSFRIGGLSLDAMQTNSETERTGLRRDNGEPPVWSCGSNADFASASQSREIRK